MPKYYISVLRDSTTTDVAGSVFKGKIKQGCTSISKGRHVGTNTSLAELYEFDLEDSFMITASQQYWTEKDWEFYGYPDL